MFQKTLKLIFTQRKPLTPKLGMFFSVLGIALLILAYTALAYAETDTIPPMPRFPLVPKFDRLYEGLKLLVFLDPQSGDYIFWKDFLVSGPRLLIAVGGTSLLCVTVGIYMGLYDFLRRMCLPIMEIVEHIPANGMMIFFLALFHTSNPLFWGVMAFGICVGITKNVYLDSKSVSDEHVFTAKTLGASEQEVTWYVVFPQIIPQIIEAVRQSISPAIVFLMGTEWIVGSDGIGHRFMQLNRSPRAFMTFPYVMALGLIGLFISYAFRKIQRVSCPWHENETPPDFVDRFLARMKNNIQTLMRHERKKETAS
ncbi:hypothetical protein A2839_01905 [Candidatus Uhrbacteria bacterium RIFCSPHIGHO2_01_FULL_47_10]|nr:MAG: hypothetical protein A2839_01905 [Candidatus Uhrbacteria bacterium RIFCSPHIGHO2_01_FULL_47_10]